MKRLLPVLVLAASVGAGLSGHAACGQATLHNKLEIYVGDVTITIAEDSPPTAAAFIVPPDQAPVPNRGCDDGSASKTAVSGSLTIARGDDVLCTKPADPSFDPFYFGGGINDMAGDCGANFSAASIPNPPLPDVEGSYVDPDGAIYLGTARDVITDVTTAYKVDGIEYVIPQDTTGRSLRGILLSGN